MTPKELIEYTEADLVSFGNYMLSETRRKSIINEVNAQSVTDACLQNWKDERDKI